MSDHITPSELAVYLGTKLQLLTSDQIRSHGLTGIQDEIVYTDSWFRCEFGISEVKPIVRSMGQLTHTITHGGEKFVPIDALKLCTTGQLLSDEETAHWVNQLMIKGILGRLSYNQTRKLIGWHFDVFNWLKRIGADGSPLALPMGLSQWGAQ